ncbi:hypothetical protein L9F63_015379, partial [Diploptera punctata]
NIEFFPYFAFLLVEFLQEVLFIYKSQREKLTSLRVALKSFSAGNCLRSVLNGNVDYFVFASIVWE